MHELPKMDFVQMSDAEATVYWFEKWKEASSEAYDMKKIALLGILSAGGLRVTEEMLMDIDVEGFEIVERRDSDTMSVDYAIKEVKR